MEHTDPTPPGYRPPGPGGLPDLPQYEVVRELGRGGMGVVYLARHTITGRDEVLKVISRALLDQPGATERFLREIRSAAKLQHPNIVATHSAMQVEGLLVHVMEYLPGEDLAVVVRDRGPLPVRAACELARQAAVGLQYAHERGLIHRDIKPSNLMLVKDGKKWAVKILDFGLAKAAGEQGGPWLTRTGAVMGTPDYMAPEQGEDAGRVDIRADIYSLGCTLYHLLTGRAPFSGSNPLHVMFGHRFTPAPGVETLRSDVPADVAAVIARMMAKSPADRYQTPAEVAAALRPFTREETPRSPAAAREAIALSSAGGDTLPPQSSITHRDAGRPTCRRPPVAWLAAAAVVVAMLVAGMYVATRESGEKPDVAQHSQPTARSPESSPVPTAKGPDSTPAEPWANKNPPPIEMPKPTPASPKEPTPGDGPPRKEPDPKPANPFFRNAVAPNAVKPAPPKEPAPGDGPTWVSKVTRMRFARIPAGTFTMGSPDSDTDRYKDETPHEVALTRDFYMGVHEVTVGQFRAFVDDTGYKTEAERGDGAYGWSEAAENFEKRKDFSWQTPGFKQPTDDHPVVCVSWKDAAAFAEWLTKKDSLEKYGQTYRLPTEAEWEYSCRGGATSNYQKYHFGDDPEELAKYGNVADASVTSKLPTWRHIKADDGYVFTSPVGTFRPNAFGLYDMHGNVWEWCHDHFADYPTAHVKNPQGQPTGLHRVRRGGSWDTVPWNCRSACRFGIGPSDRDCNLGFRLVMVPSGQ